MKINQIKNLSVFVFSSARRFPNKIQKAFKTILLAFFLPSGSVLRESVKVGTKNSILLASFMAFLTHLCSVLPANAQKIIPIHDSLPELSPNKTRLFYLQRNIDRNTLIYETNYRSNGLIDEKKPVKIYWIDFENEGKTSPLTFIQNSLAYGIESKLIDRTKKTFLLHLVAYKKIDLYLKLDKNKRYKVFTTISGKEAILSRIIVNMTGGTYLNPIISFIELSGDDLKSNASLSQKIFID